MNEMERDKSALEKMVKDQTEALDRNALEIEELHEQLDEREHEIEELSHIVGELEHETAETHSQLMKRMESTKRLRTEVEDLKSIDTKEEADHIGLQQLTLVATQSEEHIVRGKPPLFVPEMGLKCVAIY